MLCSAEYCYTFAQAIHVISIHEILDSRVTQ